jgi:hypothetical protein
VRIFISRTYSEYSRKENAGLAVSGVPSSGSSMLENEPRSEQPSRARSARRRMESLSPRLMLSSVVRSSGTATPMRSADSCRVDTEDCRRWCECRLDGGAESRLGEGGAESAVAVVIVVVVIMLTGFGGCAGKLKESGGGAEAEAEAEM